MSGKLTRNNAFHHACILHERIAAGKQFLAKERIISRGHDRNSGNAPDMGMVVCACSDVFAKRSPLVSADPSVTFGGA